ncbi:MAG: hypothetical protein V7733_03740 [Paraglaciecola polaris]|uniref:hypothetical protein n=1 Tax=Paraglaciecola polaris TaxID=222814 RepID=UPI0030032F3C|tara:strand:+ start:5409 stop:6026 length:618 start_codon:yes stop_codon:yes gene_type:complete
MELDYETANNKELELNASMRASLSSVGVEPSSIDELIGTALTPAIVIRPPKTPVSDAEASATSEDGEAKVAKAGSIKLNINTVVDQIVKTQPPGFNLKVEPWLGLYAFIEVLRLVSDLQDVTISENDAMVIWSMWFVRNRRSNTISGKDLLSKINTHLIRYDRTTLTENELEESLKNLEKIRTIRRSKNSADSWYLVGWVKRSYQ